MLHDAAPAQRGHYAYPFLNVSITPTDVSIVCPRHLAESHFRSVTAQLAPPLRQSVSVSPEDYLVVAVGGAGLDAGRRVLDVTAPLAAAGVPIFFITSYYGDFILVPFAARARVIRALEARGFIFEPSDGEAGHMTNPCSPLSHAFSSPAHAHAHRRNASSCSSIATSLSTTTSISTRASSPSPATPPHHAIPPLLHPNLVLTTCAAARPSTALHHGLIKSLTLSPPPTFLSLTWTATDSASLTLDRRLLPLFPTSSSSSSSSSSAFHSLPSSPAPENSDADIDADHDNDPLLGRHGPRLVPISFDLRHLPLASTGIVCGVATQLTRGGDLAFSSPITTNKDCPPSDDDGPALEVSYLSTARAGHVMVLEEDLGRAMRALGVGAGNQCESDRACDDA